MNESSSYTQEKLETHDSSLEFETKYVSLIQDLEGIQKRLSETPNSSNSPSAHDSLSKKSKSALIALTCIATIALCLSIFQLLVSVPSVHFPVESGKSASNSTSNQPPEDLPVKAKTRTLEQADNAISVLKTDLNVTREALKETTKSLNGIKSNWENLANQQAKVANSIRLTSIVSSGLFLITVAFAAWIVHISRGSKQERNYSMDIDQIKNAQENSILKFIDLVGLFQETYKTAFKNKKVLDNQIETLKSQFDLLNSQIELIAKGNDSFSKEVATEYIQTSSEAIQRQITDLEKKTQECLAKMNEIDSQLASTFSLVQSYGDTLGRFKKEIVSADPQVEALDYGYVKERLVELQSDISVFDESPRLKNAAESALQLLHDANKEDIPSDEKLISQILTPFNLSIYKLKIDKWSKAGKIAQEIEVLRISSIANFKRHFKSRFRIFDPEPGIKPDAVEHKIDYFIDGSLEEAGLIAFTINPGFMLDDLVKPAAVVLYKNDRANAVEERKSESRVEAEPASKTANESKPSEHHQAIVTDSAEEGLDTESTLSPPADEPETEITEIWKTD
jgi:chaperonin cofactor prefoldin